MQVHLVRQVRGDVQWCGASAECLATVQGHSDANGKAVGCLINDLSIRFTCLVLYGHKDKYFRENSGCIQSNMAHIGR